MCFLIENDSSRGLMMCTIQKINILSQKHWHDLDYRDRAGDLKDFINIALK